jgi:hypothetical protein
MSRDEREALLDLIERTSDPAVARKLRAEAIACARAHGLNLPNLS